MRSVTIMIPKNHSHLLSYTEFQNSSKDNSSWPTQALQRKDTLGLLLTYPISAPPQVKEQIAPGSLLSSRTLAIILGEKKQLLRKGEEGRKHVSRKWSFCFPRRQATTVMRLLSDEIKGFSSAMSKPASESHMFHFQEFYELGVKSLVTWNRAGWEYFFPEHQQRL